jgi:hypothetical protein
LNYTPRVHIVLRRELAAGTKPRVRRAAWRSSSRPEDAVDWSDSYVPRITGTSTIRPHPPRRASPSETLGSSMADCRFHRRRVRIKPTPARVPRALVLANLGS